jgi:DNA-directed RNA polymerase subunit RPC12/RpoP
MTITIGGTLINTGTITYTCSKCGFVHKVAEQKIVEDIKCPKCSNILMKIGTVR